MKKKSNEEKEAFLQIIQTQKEEILELQDLLIEKQTKRRDFCLSK